MRPFRRGEIVSGEYPLRLTCTVKALSARTFRELLCELCRANAGEYSPLRTYAEKLRARLKYRTPDRALLYPLVRVYTVAQLTCGGAALLAAVPHYRLGGIALCILAQRQTNGITLRRSSSRSEKPRPPGRR